MYSLMLLTMPVLTCTLPQLLMLFCCLHPHNHYAVLHRTALQRAMRHFSVLYCPIP